MTAAPLLTRLKLLLVRFSPGPRWLAGAFVAHPLNAISVLFVLVQIEALLPSQCYLASCGCMVRPLLIFGCTTSLRQPTSSSVTTLTGADVWV